jgi:hypothetical protein
VVDFFVSTGAGVEQLARMATAQMAIAIMMEDRFMVSKLIIFLVCTPAIFNGRQKRDLIKRV